MIPMKDFTLTNSYLKLPESFYEKVTPADYPDVKLLLFNKTLARELDFPFENYSDNQLARFFAGQELLPGSIPIALAYAGFQFGHPVPSLGDGRAMVLGERKGFDLQLKGSGQTPYSRRGDGRSALGPVIREYLVSEAMNALLVPTTRALAAVETGEEVYRQFGVEPGGVFTRVAPSHIRVGTFQYFSFRKDTESLKILLDFTIERHYPELKSLTSLRDKAMGLLLKFAGRQGELIAQWSAVGFIHGVMNTDNCALGGFTIDYGPCAFMDEFSFNKVFSSIDERGRYSFFNQVPIIQWNILRLADTLLPLISSEQDQAIAAVEKELIPLLETFSQLRSEKLARKLGIKDYRPQDESLVMEFLTYLEEESLDFTLSFRNLPKLYKGECSFFPLTPRCKKFVNSWKARVHDIQELDQINPLYIPRNHLVQKAIDLAYQGDISFAQKLNSVLAQPFGEIEEGAEFALPPKSDERVLKTFCGT